MSNEWALMRWVRGGMAVLCASVGLWAAPAGCARPNKVNIQLRKENAQLTEQLDTLRRENEANRARIAAMEQERGTLPTLPQSRLDEMFTVHGLELGRLTGGTDLDPGRPGDEGLRIYLSPLDQSGEALKATGHVVVEAFDLSMESGLRLGRWEFGPEQMKSAWRSFGPLQAFVLVCPWQTPPRHAEIAVRVEFRDELTGRVFTQLKSVTVKLPLPQTRPSSP